MSLLGILVLLDGLRELEISSGNFAALLRHKKQGPEVAIFMVHLSSCTACDVAAIAIFYSSVVGQV